MWRGKKDKVSFTMVWNPGSEVDCWCPDRPGKEQDLGVWESFGFKFGRTGWGGGQGGGGGVCGKRGTGLQQRPVSAWLAPPSTPLDPETTCGRAAPASTRGVNICLEQ